MNTTVPSASVAVIAGGLSKRASPARTNQREVDLEKGLPLLEQVVAERLQYRDIPNAVNTLITSVQASNDPLDRYCHSVPDRSDTPWSNAAKTAYLYIFWVRFISEQCAWTVHHGDSVMNVLPPPSETGEEDPINTVLGQILRSTSTLGRSEEEQKRTAEFGTKFRQSINKHLGDRINDMYSIASLATNPEKQGRGYASALVRSVTDKAGKEGRAVWLGSSNVAANTGFYNALGFETVDIFYIGDDNPTWTEGPLPMALMVWEPKAAQMAEKDLISFDNA